MGLILFYLQVNNEIWIRISEQNNDSQHFKLRMTKLKIPLKIKPPLKTTSWNFDRSTCSVCLVTRRTDAR